MSDQEQLTPQQERAYVEAAWERVTAYWLPSMPDRFCVEMVYDSAMVWEDNTRCGLPNLEVALTEQRAWHAAFLYTKDHERKIAEVQDEIETLNVYVYTLRGDMFCGEASSGVLKERLNIHKRILDREQAALADLLRGWREKGDGNGRG